MQEIYINIHSHRKKQQDDEFVVRNYVLPKAKTSVERINYSLSVGIHPWFADSSDIATIHRLKKLATAKNVIAIGETGLDRLKNENFKAQLELFSIHLKIAEEQQLPVIVHCVKAYSDVLAELKNTRIPVIFHDFDGNAQIVEQILKFDNTYFSLGKSLFRPQSKIVKSLHVIPNDRIFFETDTMPLPIKPVYEQYATMAKIDLKELQNIIQTNFQRVFPMKTGKSLFEK